MHSSNFPYSEPDYDHRLDKTINQKPTKTENMNTEEKITYEEYEKRVAKELKNYPLLRLKKSSIKLCKKLYKEGYSIGECISIIKLNNGF